MISVIIPTFNKADYLNLTLISFLSQSYKEFELIVIDDGSEDRTRDVVNRHQHAINIEYIYQDNRGRAAAVNTGIRHANGKFIVFSDDDAIADRDFVGEHVKELLKGAPNKVVIGWKKRVLSIWKKGCFIDRSDLLQFLMKRKDVAVSISKKDDFHVIDPNDLHRSFIDTINSILLGDDAFNPGDYFDKLVHLRWMFVTGRNMSAPIEYIKEVGMFDEYYKGWGIEDNDLAYRLHLNGSDFIVNKKAINYHQQHPIGTSGSMKQDLDQRNREWKKNAEYFCRKYNSLEALILWRMIDSKIDLMTADDFLSDMRKITNPNTLKELISVYNELLALTIHNHSEDMSGLWQRS